MPNHLPRRLALYTIYILCLAAQRVAFAQILKLSITHGPMPGYGYSIFTHMTVGGSSIWAVVDTGSANTFFVWKDWYEKELGEGACKDFKSGCYTCPTSCEPHGFDYIEFADGTVVDIFDYKDTMKLGDAEIANLHFGLVYEQDPPPKVRPAFSLLGLSPYTHEAFNSLLEQLVGKSHRTITSKTFAVYLIPTPDSGRFSGALLLGGGDPNVYKHPISYVKFNSQEEYTITLASVKVGTTQLQTGNERQIILDTGANAFFVPQANGNYDRLVEAIKTEASKTSSEISFVWDAKAGLWKVPCIYRPAMPTITLLFGTKGEVPLTLTHINYVRGTGTTCFLILRKTTSLMWSLAGEGFIGNYFEFQPEKGQVGIAKLST